MREVGLSQWKRDGKFSAGIDVAEEHIGNCVGTAAPRKPSFENSADLLSPRHSHRVSRLEHDDGVRISGGNFGDQIVLISGSDRLASPAFGLPAIANTIATSASLRRATAGLDRCPNRN